MRPISGSCPSVMVKFSLEPSKSLSLLSAAVPCLGLISNQIDVFVVTSKLWYTPVCRKDHGSAPSVRPLCSGYFNVSAISASGEKRAINIRKQQRNYATNLSYAKLSYATRPRYMLPRCCRSCLGNIVPLPEILA